MPRDCWARPGASRTSVCWTPPGTRRPKVRTGGSGSSCTMPQGGRPADVTVSVSSGTVVSAVELDTAVAGQAPVLHEEFELVEQMLAADERWLAALATRGLTSAGPGRSAVGRGLRLPRGEGRRMLRGSRSSRTPRGPCLGPPGRRARRLRRRREPDVTEVLDVGAVPDPRRAATSPTGLTGPLRTNLKPIQITQPDGPSFTLDGNTSLAEVGPATSASTPAKGWCSPDRLRRRRPAAPVIDRASIAEMVVPYGDPAPNRSWQNYFDTGEYLVGRYANSLELGCDCLGEITYLDAVVADDFGNPREIRRRSASTRRTSGCSGSTPTCGPASTDDPPPAAPRRLASSPRSATTTTASTGTCTSTAPSSSR